jgi:hypothetical protein
MAHPACKPKLMFGTNGYSNLRMSRLLSLYAFTLGDVRSSNVAYANAMSAVSAIDGFHSC